MFPYSIHFEGPYSSAVKGLPTNAALAGGAEVQELSDGSSQSAVTEELTVAQSPGPSTNGISAHDH